MHQEAIKINVKNVRNIGKGINVRGSTTET